MHDCHLVSKNNTAQNRKKKFAFSVRHIDGSLPNIWGPNEWTSVSGKCRANIPPLTMLLTLQDDLDTTTPTIHFCLLLSSAIWRALEAYTHRAFYHQVIKVNLKSYTSNMCLKYKSKFLALVLGSVLCMQAVFYS